MVSERTALFVAIALVLAALAVAPAAARAVADNSNIFVGEKNLDVSVMNGGVAFTGLVHYSGAVGEAIDDEIAVTGGIINEVRTGTKTGNYYVDGNASAYLNVLVPEVTLDVVLNQSKKDSVAGKSVTRDTPMDFKLSNNLDGLPGATMDIEVTLPGGGVTTQFGGQSLKDIPADGTTVYMGAIDLSDAPAGTYAAQAKWPSTSDFYGKGFDSNTVAFEVLTRSLAITISKDTVVRGNSFTVTITGDSLKAYNLIIQDEDGLAENLYPYIVASQNGVDQTGMVNSHRNATVTTNAAGARSVQFNTGSDTDARSFTIHVEDPLDFGIYDEVKMRVEEGDVTITASGTGVYHIGEEVTLSGTCTDNATTVHLFMTGPNLRSANGVNLLSLLPVSNAPVAGVSDVFNTADVKSDDTWSFKWNTGDIAALGGALDSGGYTIYAVSKPMDKTGLSNAEYATASVQLRNPTLTARSSGTTLTRGDDYWIRGVATGDPDAVRIWIFGKNLQISDSATVETDGSFEYELRNTDDLSTGRHFVVIQHPMMDKVFGIGPEIDPVTGEWNGWISGTGTSGFTRVRIAGLWASDAATALINALDSPNIDDTYIKFSFTVGDNSWIRIDGLPDQTYGETFTVTGTTGYPAGTVLDYRIAAADDSAVVLSGEATVTSGGDWSIDLDTAAIGPGAFTLRVTGPDDQASAIAFFDVYDDLIHPVPPGGASYRVERLDVTPSLDDLSAGEGVALDGFIRLDDTFGSSRHFDRILEFSTDLQNPAWSYSLEVGDQKSSIGPMTVNTRSFTLSDWDLDYSWSDVRILLHLSGTVPQGADDPILLRILEREGDGRVVPGSEHLLSIPLSGDDPAPPLGDTLPLAPGWNFISVPRPLAAGNDTATIFAGVVDADGHSIFRYDTANKTWIALDKADRLAPLEGFWIYSAGPATVPLNFSTDPITSLPERSLAAGWNAVGITGTAPATARDTFYSVREQWSTLIGYNAGAQTFETGIVNGGSGEYADNRLVYQGRGYWLYMNGPGTLCAIGA